MISKNTDPSIKTILVGLLLFIVGALTYWFLERPVETKEMAKTEVVPEFFDYGVVYDSLYCNSFFNFTIPLFKGHETFYKTYNLVPRSLIQYDTVPLNPTRREDINSEVLLHIEPEFEENVQDFLKANNVLKDSNWVQNFDAYVNEKSKRDLFGADYQFRISCYRLENESLSQHIAKYENLHHPGYGQAKTTTVGGVLFQEYHGTDQQQNFLLGMRTKKIISYVTEIYGFILFIDLFYETEEQKHLLLDMVNQLQFSENASEAK